LIIFKNKYSLGEQIRDFYQKHGLKNITDHKLLNGLVLAKNAHYQVDLVLLLVNCDKKSLK